MCRRIASNAGLNGPVHAVTVVLFDEGLRLMVYFVVRTLYNDT